MPNPSLADKYQMNDPYRSQPAATATQSTATQSTGNYNPSGLGTLDYEIPTGLGYGDIDSEPYGDGEPQTGPRAPRGAFGFGVPQNTSPDATFAQVALQQHQFVVRQFRPFEKALISSLDDESLVKAVPGEVERQGEIAKGIAERNRQRYGYQRTGAEAQEGQRAFQRQQTLNLTGGTNTARLAQRQRNKALLSDLINISQGQNRSSLQGLAAAGQNSVDRENQYQQAKSAHKQQSMQSIGALISMIAMYAWSDERLKENIQYVGKAPQGHNLYTWEWNEIAKGLGINEPAFGVIAQELLETHPEAVSLSPIHGYYMVDYGRVLKKFSLGEVQKAYG